LPHISLEIIPQPQLSLLQTSARMQPWLIIRNTSPGAHWWANTKPNQPSSEPSSPLRPLYTNKASAPQALQRSLFNSMESSTFSESDNRAGPSQCVTAEQKTYLSAVAGGPDPEQSTRPLSPTPQPEHPALSDFQLTKRIGQGSWGTFSSPGRHCAISSVYDTLKKEAQILASLDHTFIVKIEAAFQTQDCLFIGLELAVGGTFSDLLEMFAILISSGQYTIPYPIDFPCLSFLKRLLSQSHNRRLLNMNSICDEYIYFAKVNWNHLSERRYEAPYTPGDSASYITPTRRDWSPKFATRLIPRKSDQFPGLFDDFYFLGAGSPW
ncbi:hypothetical protein PSTT_00214, partial [Puccinia striiformis]